MQRIVLAAAFLVLIPSFALAAPCVPGTVTNYVSLGSGGCQIGVFTFFDFVGLPSFAGGVAISPSAVQVTPTINALGPRLDFFLTGSAAAGQLFGIAIGYSISGGLLNGATLSMAGSAATGDGVVTAVEDICRGGTFVSTPPFCNGSGQLTLITVQDAIGPTGPDSQKFVVSSFFDVFTDIAIDGGLSGTARLGAAGGPPGSVTNQFAAPEPASVSVLGIGLLSLWVLARYRNKRQPMETNHD
jgi:hypothetical protein